MKTLREYIQDAEGKGIAVGHFNFANLEGLHAIVEAAQELDVPIVLGTSEGERDFVGVEEAVALVKTLREETGHPIFLNADHSYSLERVKEAIDAGYDSVIFDGVKMPLEENIEITKQAVEYARSVNPDILVEAELGYIGKSSSVLDEVPEGVGSSDEFLTTPEEAKRFVDETGVDLLAPAVGNMHGMLKSGAHPKLNIERIKEIREACGVPLVLHGGSGSSEEDFTDAISAGISLVHINTEIRVAFKEGIEEYMEEKPDDVAPYRYLNAGKEAMKEAVLKRLRLFSGM
jgi:fructose-bisphosphate aldolase, class II